jgi:hypothetical protein
MVREFRPNRRRLRINLAAKAGPIGLELFRMQDRVVLRRVLRLQCRRAHQRDCDGNETRCSSGAITPERNSLHEITPSTQAALLLDEN